MPNADKLIEQIPWVKRLKYKKPHPCQGIKWSKVALKHLYSMSGRPPEGIPERARCKFNAKWRFIALQRSHAKTGEYCVHHLFSNGLYADNEEYYRYLDWRKSIGEQVDDQLTLVDDHAL